MITRKITKVNPQEEIALYHTINKTLNIPCKSVEIYNVYYFDQPVKIFELQEIKELPTSAFIVKEHEGQYHQAQDLLQKRLKNIYNLATKVKMAKAYDVDLDNPSDLNLVKQYLINPIIEKEITDQEITFEDVTSDLYEHQEVSNFIDMDEEALNICRKAYGFDEDDFKYIQDYFIKEQRNPRIIELKLLESYWSDHCRHTTFLTELVDIDIEEGPLSESIKETLKDYENTRKNVYGDRVKPRSLMDLATINAKALKQAKLLNHVEETDEVNACSVEVDIEVDGKVERWLHMFKNETHNHPTEIEPYGGAHTCIGGAIRDPLSGRAKIIGGIRIVGAGNPLEKVSDTLSNKLPQVYLSQTARQGFSDYANQIGASVGLVKEFYDEGYKAKRMELGALVAAVSKDEVTRKPPQAGDVVLLLGAPTGRDGLGAAVGSSSAQTTQSLKKAGAQVQKGNPFEQRKIMRLFDHPQASKLIKKSNDFGAGGVSVAIGELASGLHINLNQVPTKYPGMNGYEIALSESQERMAVVVSVQDVDEFVRYCEAEEVICHPVATINDSHRLTMEYNGEILVDLSRELLDSAGAKKEMNAIISSQIKPTDSSHDRINQAITPGLSQGFDSTLGRNRVFMEYGGKTLQTQQCGIVTKFPIEKTNAVSVMTYGFHLQASKRSAFLGGYQSTLQAITSNIAITGTLQGMTLSMQEFFPSIKNDPRKMGLPTAALLGAYRVMKDLKIGAIGGKDSMSGTYQNLEVPPTLVCFAVNTSTIDRVVSREFKQEGSKVYITKIQVHQHLLDLNQYQEVMSIFSQYHQAGQVLAASDIGEYGLKRTLEEMGAGNQLLVEIKEQDYPELGQIVFEVAADVNVDERYFDRLGTTKTQAITLDQPLSEIYPSLKLKPLSSRFESKEFKGQPLTLENSKVCLLVLEGSTGEEDLQAVLEKEGFEVDCFILKTSSHPVFVESLQQLKQTLQDVSILALPHGDYRSLNMEVILKEVKEEIENLRNRQGLVLGIGAGFEALIKKGYFGDAITIESNPSQHYFHGLIECEVIADSPLSQKGQRYTSLVSTSSLITRSSDRQRLQNQAHILAIRQTLSEHDIGIEVLSSHDYQIIGISSLVERMANDLYLNVIVSGYPNYFKHLGQHLKKAGE